MSILWEVSCFNPFWVVFLFLFFPKYHVFFSASPFLSCDPVIVLCYKKTNSPPERKRRRNINSRPPVLCLGVWTHRGSIKHDEMLGIRQSYFKHLLCSLNRLTSFSIKLKLIKAERFSRSEYHATHYICTRSNLESTGKISWPAIKFFHWKGKMEGWKYIIYTIIQYNTDLIYC